MKIDKEIDNDDCRAALKLAVTNPSLWAVPNPIDMGALLWHGLIEIKNGDIVHLTKKGTELHAEWFPPVSEYKVYGGPFNISVAYVTDGMPNGIANADFAPHMGGDSRWWLARVVIKDGRGKGIGSEMLRLLKEELKKNENFTELLVAPGGYGSDEKKQMNFYLKNGFVPVSEGGLLWRP